jgi:hypothetical protein
MFDYALKEKPKKTSDWMVFNQIESGLIRILLDALENLGVWKEESSLYNTKQRSRLFHIDSLEAKALPAYFDDSKTYRIQIASEENYKGKYLMINYLRRDFIHNNGEALIVVVE